MKKVKRGHRKVARQERRQLHRDKGSGRETTVVCRLGRKSAGEREEAAEDRVKGAVGEGRKRGVMGMRKEL